MRNGNSFEEAVSKLSPEDICQAAQRRYNGMPFSANNNAFAILLNSISTSCRQVGHSRKAAKDARR